MTKALYLVVSAGIAVSTVAATYYVSPVQPSQLDVPPLHVSKPPEIVIAELKHLSAESFLRQSGGDIESLVALISSQMEMSTADTILYTISFDSEVILKIKANIIAKEDGSADVDIVASLPESSFRRDPNLHPYDLKIIEAVGDLLATEYFGSVLSARRMATESELEKKWKNRIDFSDEQKRLFVDRVEMAFDRAFGERIREIKSAMGDEDGYSSEVAYWDNSDVSDNATAPAVGTEAPAEPSDNSEFAAQAATRAALEAQQAAEEAARAGEVAARRAKYGY